MFSYRLVCKHESHYNQNHPLWFIHRLSDSGTQQWARYRQLENGVANYGHVRTFWFVFLI